MRILKTLKLLLKNMMIINWKEKDLLLNMHTENQVNMIIETMKEEIIYLLMKDKLTRKKEDALSVPKEVTSLKIVIFYFNFKKKF